MTIESKLRGLKAETAKQALETLLLAYARPAFGALPKREIDLLMFKILLDLEIVSKDTSIYQIMRDLRVTRPKARALLYDLEVRKAEAGSEHLDKAIHKRLIEARFHKDTDYFVLDVEDPLLQDHLRERVRSLGHITDGSFSASIVRLTLPAVGALAEAVMPKADQDKVRKALIEAGAPDESFQAMVTSALGHVAARLIGEAGKKLTKAAIDEASDYVQPLFKASASAITKAFKGVIPHATDGT